MPTPGGHTIAQAQVNVQSLDQAFERGDGVFCPKTRIFRSYPAELVSSKLRQPLSKLPSRQCSGYTIDFLPIPEDCQSWNASNTEPGG